MKTSFFSLFLFIGFFIFISCQNEQTHYIAVNGAGKVNVPIDYFKVNITIKTENINLVKANDENKNLVFKMFDILRKYSIIDSDFVTNKSQSSVNLISPYIQFNRDKIIPSIEYSGDLILRNPKNYDAIFKDLMSLGNIDVHINDFGSYSIEQYRIQAYKLATSNAKKQAELLLSGTGNHIGKIYKILQDGIDRSDYYDDIDKIIESRQVKGLNVEAAALTNTFRKNFIEETATVTVIYEIK
jgi:uncharacterized protein YggE